MGALAADAWEQSSSAEGTIAPRSAATASVATAAAARAACNPSASLASTRATLGERDAGTGTQSGFEVFVTHGHAMGCVPGECVVFLGAGGVQMTVLALKLEPEHCVVSLTRTRCVGSFRCDL